MSINTLIDLLHTFPLNEEPSKFAIIQHTGLKNVHLLNDPVVKHYIKRMNEAYELSKL